MKESDRQNEQYPYIDEEKLKVILDCLSDPSLAVSTLRSILDKIEIELYRCAKDKSWPRENNILKALQKSPFPDAREIIERWISDFYDMYWQRHQNPEVDIELYNDRKQKDTYYILKNYDEDKCIFRGYVNRCARNAMVSASQKNKKRNETEESVAEADDHSFGLTVINRHNDVTRQQPMNSPSWTVFHQAITGGKSKIELSLPSIAQRQNAPDLSMTDLFEEISFPHQNEILKNTIELAPFNLLKKLQLNSVREYICPVDFHQEMATKQCIKAMACYLYEEERLHDLKEALQAIAIQFARDFFVTYLRSECEWEHKEIAWLLNESEENVRQIYCRIKKSMINILEELI